MRYTIAHRDRHAHCTLRGVRYLDGIVEEDHHAVAGEALERAFVLEDQLSHLGVVLAEHAHHFLGLRGLGERRESPQIEEHHGHFPAVRLQRVVCASGNDQLGQLRREEALQT